VRLVGGGVGLVDPGRGGEHGGLGRFADEAVGALAVRAVEYDGAGADDFGAAAVVHTSDVVIRAMPLWRCTRL